MIRFEPADAASVAISAKYSSSGPCLVVLNTALYQQQFSLLLKAHVLAYRQ